MRCAHCFARFDDAGHGNLPRDLAIQVVRELGRGFERITFVGGEPTLCPWLLDLCFNARDVGMSVGLVTNGWRLAREPAYLHRMLPHLDWLGLSIDSLDPAINAQIGRTVRGQTVEIVALQGLARATRDARIFLKVNTVVQRANANEDMRTGLQAIRPDRWKVLQVLPVLGQNDLEYASCAVSRTEFLDFVDRHRDLESAGVVIVPEDHAAMTESYAMVDPAGYAFDNADGRYRYSARPVHEVGWENAFAEIRLDVARFRERAGDHYKQGGSR
jgi:radical S-adenosyl methionine domain-containing protein 2